MNNLLKDGTLKTIAKNAAIIFTGNSTASAFNLASFAIMANQIGPEYLGVFVLCQTYALIINDLLNVETWESMIKFGSIDTDESNVKSVIITNLLIDFVSATIAFVAGLLLAWPTATLLGWVDTTPSDLDITTLLAAYSFSIFFNLTTFTVGIPRLFRKFLSVSIVHSAAAAAKLIAIVAVMFSINTFESYFFIYLSFEIITNASLIVLSIHIIKSEFGRYWWKQTIKLNRDQFRFIWWTNLRTIIRIPVRRLDVIIISSVMDLYTLGIYKVYKELAGLIARVGDPINQAIYPEFSKMIGEKDSSKSITVTKQTMTLLLFVGMFLFSALCIGSGLFIENIFGHEYLTMLSALYLMYFWYTISFITVPINSLFIAAGFAKYSFFALLFTNSAYLVSAYSLGIPFGIYGLVAAYAIQLILNKGIKIYLMKKYSEDWDTQTR